MPNRREQPPRPETKADQPINLDDLTTKWFERPPQELIDSRRDSGVLEHALPPTAEQQARISRWFERRSAARFAMMVPAVAAMLSASCEMNSQNEGSEASVDTSTMVPLSITEDQGDVVIALNVDHTIRISDYAGREHWDAPLLDENNHQVENNITFQLHVQVMRDQYDRSIEQADSVYLADKQGPLGTTVKYTIEPSRMYPGEYPSYSDLYGNMHLGNTEADVEYMKTYVENAWLESAKTHFGDHYQTVQDLDTLSAAQWMVVLQEPAENLSYDPSLTSLYPQYDASKTLAHNQKTMAELVDGSVGVCRDYERLNITSYVLADEQFHLAERGLLYIPQVNMSDAAHTEGMFLFAKSVTETIVVGVNTTDAGNNLDSFTHIPDTVAWYSQQYSKEFVDSPEHAIEAYQGVLDVLGGEMNPVARAMLKREVILANLRGAEAADTQATKKPYLAEAFTTLQSQLIEEAALNTRTLDRPSRVVPMYDLLLATAAAYDEVDASAVNGLHMVAARSLFEAYLQKNAGVELEVAREAIDLIDQAGTQQERSQYYNRLIELLEQKR